MDDAGALPGGAESDGRPANIVVKTENPPRVRTVSPVALLQGVKCIGADPALNHLFIHVYIPYARCGIDVNPLPFLVQSIPTHEGWYSGWLEFVNVVENRGIAGPILRCILHWHDGTAQYCFVSKDGEFVMHLAPDNPSNGVHLDSSVVPKKGKLKNRAVVQISHTMTADEIESGIRGVVHGSVMAKNNGRKISHVISVENDSTLRCALYPKTDDVISAPQIVTLPSSRIQKYVPELLREFKFRIDPRFTEREAVFILKYVSALYSRARDNDIAVRMAIRVARYPGLHSSRSQQLPQSAATSNCDDNNMAMLEELLRGFQSAIEESESDKLKLTANGLSSHVAKNQVLPPGDGRSETPHELGK